MIEFSAGEESKIRQRFGDGFYSQILGRLELVAEKWLLHDLTLIPSYSSSLVFYAESDLYGHVLLKLGRSIESLMSEVKALSLFSKDKVCILYEVERDLAILIEERIQPGTTLRELEPIELRLKNFVDLYRGFHKPIEQYSTFDTYEGWLTRIADYMTKEAAYTELSQNMSLALSLFREISKSHHKVMLLHGDFHQDNILLTQAGNYKLIDPKGVVGDPLFDVGRFIINEFFGDVDEASNDQMAIIIEYLSKALSLPEITLRQCFFIELMLAFSWSVESGLGEGDYEDILSKMMFANCVLNQMRYVPDSI